jgi:tRNA(Ile)-lysidine synthase
MYHVPVRSLPQTVLDYIRKHELLKAGDRVGAAVSGGADSVAMLRLLLALRGEFGIVLSVVHFNHKLRAAESDEDETFVAKIARTHDLEFHCASGEVRAYSAEKRLSLETAAREMRYAYFRDLIAAGTLGRIATAHTLDDQAETVLLRLVRGAGTRGLAGIYPALVVPGSNQQSALSTRPGNAATGAIVRPLLRTRRSALESYLAGLGQGWREDRSNRDLRHARNRVRHGILPRLERNLNPAVKEALAETAEIARAEEQFWQAEVARWLPQVWRVARGRASEHPGGALQVAPLAGLPLAFRRRLVRAAAESLGLRLEFLQVEEVLELIAADERSPRAIELQHGWSAQCGKGELEFALRGNAQPASDYQYQLPVPGSVDVREAGCRFEVIIVQRNSNEVYNPEHLLGRGCLGKELVLRNWRAGDCFWPAHTRAPKKIKELLQERHVTGTERKLWPVIISGTEIVWLRGFPVPGRLRPKNNGEAVLIRELPIKV